MVAPLRPMRDGTEILKPLLLPPFEIPKVGPGFDIYTLQAYWNGENVRLNERQFYATLAIRINSPRPLSYARVYELMVKPQNSGVYTPRTPLQLWKKCIQVTMCLTQIKYRKIDPSFGCIKSVRNYGYYWKKSDPPAGAEGS